MKLVVFSICKDEEDAIGKLLDRIPKKIAGVDKIEKLVISDGSTDNTAETGRNHGAIVIEGAQQKRLAYRFQEAMETVLDMGADIAVGIDGDLQFKPEDIPKLVKPITEEGYEFVHGDRFTDTKTGKTRRPPNMPFSKYLSNVLGAWIVSKLTKQKFTDVTCGFRAYTRKAMIAININSTYTYTQESFQVLALKKINIKGMPIEVKYYKGRKSRVVESFSKFLVGSAINILRAYRDFAPLRFFGWLGAWAFLIGLGALVFVGQHWLRTNAFSPYKFVGIGGIYFVTMGLFFWALGLVADMFSRSLSNQEKIVENMKKLRFNKPKK